MYRTPGAIAICSCDTAASAEIGIASGSTYVAVRTSREIELARFGLQLEAVEPLCGGHASERSGIDLAERGEQLRDLGFRSRTEQSARQELPRRGGQGIQRALVPDRSVVDRGRPASGVDAELAERPPERATEIDGVGALIQAIAVALVGARPSARLRALQHDHIDPSPTRLAGGGRGGDQAGEASSDDDDVCLSFHA